MRHALWVSALVCGVHPLGAQSEPPPRDSARAVPRVALADRDTIKAPFPVADAVASRASGRIWQWRGDEIFQTGATSLAELLELIPGVQVLRSGFLLGPQVISWLGEPGRVRVFSDGVELDVLDRRVGRAQDVGAVPLWHLDEVLVEASPSELRVHLRTWRVDRTTPATRVDVLTGDFETNLYRGYFGRRFQSGLGVQFGFQQFSFATPDRGGDGDALALFARVGVARARWSVDVTTQRLRGTRNATLREDRAGAVPAFAGGPSSSALRVAFGSPDRGGAWAQLIAAALSFEEATEAGLLPPSFGTVPADTVDSTAFRAQYVAAGGVRLYGIDASAAMRYRRMSGDGVITPSLRLRWGTPRLSVAAYVERSSEDSTARGDVTVHMAPVAWLAVNGTAGRRSPIDHHPGRSSTVARLEAEIRARGIVAAIGVVTRDSADAAAPVVFDSRVRDTVASAATGVTYGIQLPVYKAVRAEIHGTRWESADVYRPLNTLRTRVGIDTDWRSRFPRGEFTVRAAGTMYNVSGWLMPDDNGLIRLPSARVYSTLLEVRVRSATISWEFRNAAGARYQTVPGYTMPRILNLYGVRWRFTN